MGARVQSQPGQYKDEIDIATTMVEQATGGIEKTSLVNTIANDTSPGSHVWIGLKIDQRQKVLGLSVDGKIWVDANTPLDAAAINEFGRLMPPRADEQWAAYEVKPGNLPLTPTSGTKPFVTKLKLNQHVVSDPDAQTVAIVVCYIPQGKPLERKDILLGHSLVQSPRPAARP